MTDISEEEELLYGKGIELDGNWDIVVDGSRDVSVNRGVGELEKDLTFKVRRAISGIIGRHITPSLRERAKSRAERVLNQDERVEEVVSVRIYEVDNPNDDRDLILEAEMIAIGRDIINASVNL